MCAEGSSWANCESRHCFGLSLIFQILSNMSKESSIFWIVYILWFLLLKLFTSLLYPNRLVSTLTLLSKKLNCYKITLECAPKNVAFYQKFGYSASDETYMQCRFFDWERKFKKKKKKICFGKNGLYLCTPGDNQNLQNVLRTGASRGWGCCCVTAESSMNTHHDFSTLE